jgi:hypothetical protein
VATPSAVGRTLITLTNPKSLEQISHAMGLAGKKAASDAAKADLGSDLRMSNLGKSAKLSSGYDIKADVVLLHLRPAGLWNLADKGRRRSGTIRPRKRRALRTPQGARALSSFRPSRGLHTIDDALKIMATEVPKAADKAVDEIVRSI